MSVPNPSARAVAAPWGPADDAMASLLFVTPRPVAHASTDERPDGLLSLAVFLSAVRCILRYVVLPFGLPLLGLAPGLALGITLVVDVIAVIATVAGVRRLWAARHPRRWQYLMISCGVFLVIGMLFVMDVLVPALATAG